MPSATDIAADIARRIVSGEWRSGEVLPTTKELAEEYEVSTSTIYSVLVRLKDRNLVRGKRGGRRYVV